MFTVPSMPGVGFIFSISDGPIVRLHVHTRANITRIGRGEITTIVKPKKKGMNARKYIISYEHRPYVTYPAENGWYEYVSPRNLLNSV